MLLYNNIDVFFLQYLRAKDDYAEQAKIIADFFEAKKQSGILTVEGRSVSERNSLELWYRNEFRRKLDDTVEEICADKNALSGECITILKSAKAKTDQIVTDKLKAAYYLTDIWEFDATQFLAEAVQPNLTPEEQEIVHLLENHFRGSNVCLKIIHEKLEKLGSEREELQDAERQKTIGTPAQQRENIRKYIDSQFKSYFPSLCGRYKKNVKIGAYGEKTYKAWKKELKYFFSEVIRIDDDKSFPDADFDEEEVFEILYQYVTTEIEKFLAKIK